MKDQFNPTETVETQEAEQTTVQPQTPKAPTL